jgi:hypothetical protein
MGDLEKMQPWLSKRDFFRPSWTKRAFAPKSGQRGRADALPLYRMEPHDCQGGSKLLETEK